jgi:hypothetical protein
MKLYKNTFIFGIIATGVLLAYAPNALSQSMQPSLTATESSGTPVRLVLQDFASRPIADSSVTINSNSYKTDKDGGVNVASLPVGQIEVSVEWKGGVYEWPPQTITASETEQLITLRMPILASYGLTTPRLLILGGILFGLVFFVLIIKWLRSSYKTYKDNKFHSANPYGHVSNRTLKRASKNNPDALSFAPIDSQKPKAPAPTHQPLPAIPIPVDTAPKKEPSRPVTPPTPAPAAAVKAPTEQTKVQAIKEPISASSLPNKAAVNPSNPVNVKVSKTPAPQPVNKVNGEVLPTGIEVHDLTE